MNLFVDTLSKPLKHLPLEVDACAVRFQEPLYAHHLPSGQIRHLSMLISRDCFPGVWK